MGVQRDVGFVASGFEGVGIGIYGCRVWGHEVQGFATWVLGH